MMFLLYNLLLTLFSPLWVPWMLIRTARRKEKPNWQERMGRLSIPPLGDRPRIWFHTVSVGEYVAAMPILREIRRILPQHEIILSVTTSSGHRTATDRAEGLYDHLIYMPIDVPRFMLSAMQQVRPQIVAIMETELWMNFLWAAKVFGAKTILVNGRISDRSYRRSMLVKPVYHEILRKMDLCLMQSEVDADRISDLGARHVDVVGNCKFDQALEGLDASPAFWRDELGLDPDLSTVVVGSLRAEEFGFFREAVRGLTGVQWIIAPRHLERANELVSVMGKEMARRSLGEKMPPNGFMLLDTYGELSAVYSVADFVIVGGGFANLGGQNLLQPLAHGKPVLHGPHMQNFAGVAAIAADAGATTVCSSPEDLSLAIQRLLPDAEERARMGRLARKVVDDNLGASQRYADAIAGAARSAQAAVTRDRSATRSR